MESNNIEVSLCKFTVERQGNQKRRSMRIAFLVLIIMYKIMNY